MKYGVLFFLFFFLFFFLEYNDLLLFLLFIQCENEFF